MQIKPTVLGSLGAIITAALMISCAQAADQVIDPGRYASAGLVKPYEIVDCTLSNGEAAQCAQLVVKHLPDGMQPGPFCPATVNDAGGIWVWDGDQPGLYSLDQAFWSMLEGFGFNFINPDGTVNIQDPGLRQRPDSSKNYCLSASPDETVEATIQIPLVPVLLNTPKMLGTIAYVGLALDGVPIFADAPSVLNTGNLPALDTCGGHFDPSGYYHWHEVATDMDTTLAHAGLDVHCNLGQSSSALFAYAYDGYPIYGSSDEGGVKPANQDACNGHISPTVDYPGGVYHYHASIEAKNLPPCLVGATSEIAFQTNAAFGAGSKTAPERGPANARPATTTPVEARVTLYVFGPELGFMHEVTGNKLDFAWSDVIASGDTAVGTITGGAGEVVGINGEFYVADQANPTPKKITDELTPSAVVATFTPQETFSVSPGVDLAGLQAALDEKFIDTGIFVYMFRAHGVLSSVEYQLAGPKPNDEVKQGINSGASQKAVTIGTPKYTATNVMATLVGIRAPAYLNTVFEIPYHIHFIADDRSLLGHVTALEAESLEISWVRSDAVDLHYWDTE